jgi:thioredoxin reductase (NADPH)
MSGKIKNISSAEFEEEVLKSGKVVVDFYSTECPLCEALAAKYEPLSEIYGSDVKFIKIFRQENRELAASLGVSSSPTLLFYDNGKRIGNMLTGGIKRSEIVRNLELLIPKERAAEIQAGVQKLETKSTLHRQN